MHNIRDMKVMHTIRETPPNPSGLCALAPDSNDRCFLAYPGNSVVGEIQIFDAMNLVNDPNSITQFASLIFFFC